MNDGRLHAPDLPPDPMPPAPPYFVRPFEPADAPSFLAAVQESLAELVYWMPWCKPDYALRDAEAWIAFTQKAWAERSEFPLGIFETASGRVVGGAGVHDILRRYQLGSVGYWVSSRHVGRGVARFAARETALLAFGELQLTRLEIVALTHNVASQRVAQALGATRECEARNRLVFQGKPHDAVVYSLVPADVGLE